MNVRLTLTIGVLGIALGAALSGCSTMPAKLKAFVTAPIESEVTASAAGPIGHRLDEVTALNGPASQEWDMPDGRKAYQWQSSSVSATVGPARKGEIKTAGVSQTTCYYTLYTRADAKGVVKVVGAEDPRPGCMTLAMIGQSR
jgi:hypothetical protein